MRKHTDQLLLDSLKMRGKVLSIGKRIEVPGCEVTFVNNVEDVVLKKPQSMFDWVYCHGAIAFQSQKLNVEFLESLCGYAKHVAVVYHTTQTGRMEQNRFHHKKQTLDHLLSKTLIASRMVGNFYVATLSRSHLRFDWGFVTVEDLVVAAKRLVPMIPPEVGAIVSMHRSGSIPSVVIASLLHLPCHVYSVKNGLVEMGGGGRTAAMKDTGACRLVIDDTVCSGKSIRNVRKWLAQHDPRNRYLYAAIFASPHGASELDFFANTLRTPHVLEWNVLNSGHCRNSAVDLDGILCFDPPPFDETTKKGRSDYLHWIASATVKYPARWGPIGSIVSYRCEYTRCATEAWLAKSGIQVDKLHLFPGEPQERTFRASQWKGKVYKSGSHTLFIESSSKQALDIHQFSGKPVLDIERRIMLGVL